MIVRPVPRFWELFYVLQGSVLSQIAVPVLSLGLWAAVVVLCAHWVPGFMPVAAVGTFSFFGIALSIFLGFRNSASYDRWWEGRRQFGALVLESRSLARECQVWFAPVQKRRSDRMLGRILLFPYALTHQLRGDSMPQALLQGELTPAEQAALSKTSDPASVLLHWLSADLVEAVRNESLPAVMHPAFETHISALAGIQACCERLRHTPLPYPYLLLLHRTVYFFCMLLPLALATPLGWLTPLVTIAVAYTFLGLEALSDELVEPFGSAAHDLPLMSIARGIEISVRQLRGDVEIPEPMQPERYRLM